MECFVLVTTNMAGYPVYKSKPSVGISSKTNSKATSASVAKTGLFSAVVEAIFTLSIMFSLSLTPFIMVQALAPTIMMSLITSWGTLLIIPYVIIMSMVGLKVSSLFGCQAWDNIIKNCTE